MNSQDHLVCCRSVVEGFILVAQPQELLLAVSLADIHAEPDEGLIHRVPEGVRLLGVRGALDGDSPVIIGAVGGAPGTVLLLYIQANEQSLV